VIGWAVNLPGVKLALLDPAGRMMALDGAIRWYREDIVQAVGQDYGNYTFNSGMLQAWQLPFRIGDEIRLVAFDGDAAFILSTGRWDAAPTEPTSFARWAFELPTPLDRFYERMENHDGAIIESLIARDRTHWRTVCTRGPPIWRPCRKAEMLDHHTAVRTLRFHPEPDARILGRRANKARRGPDLRH
jgi:hypothetical protein